MQAHTRVMEGQWVKEASQRVSGAFRVADELGYFIGSFQKRLEVLLNTPVGSPETAVT